ncbi:MAG: EAL domain-containing protein, partial [Clostridia bacterium]|nr:EAL domain-containing protein [Clostridia bacterium]
LFVMLAVLFVQALVFAGVILYGGTIEELNNNSFEILNQRVTGRKNYLQNEAIQRWSNLAKFEHDIQGKINSFLQEKDINNSKFQQEQDLAYEFLERVVEDAIFVIRQRMVTGAFIVLNGENGEQCPGIYIRDLDPLFNPNDNSDLIMEIGPSAVARKAGICLGRSWMPQFILSEEDDNFDFYYKTMWAAKEHPDAAISDLGYWSRPFKLDEYDVEVITYSVPLIDEKGNPYGVIGIDLTLDYLRKMLYFDEIVGNKQGVYLLGIWDEEDMAFENVLSSGPMFKKFVGDESQIVFKQDPRYANIYKLQTDRTSETIYGCIHRLKLYNTNTPFENDNWVLAGVVDENSLLKPTKNIKLFVMIALFVTLVVGIIGVIFAGMWFVKPITSLVRELGASNPEEAIVLEKTNITEIDDLALAIEAMSSKVADSASRLSRIIGMVNIPIGAFEHDLSEDKVFCTSAFFNIVGIETDDRESSYISSEYFHNILKNIKKHPEHDLEDIYRYQREDGSITWIRLKIQQDSDKILGILEDATREIKDKRKIEYERDHDLLTGLINRRAFQMQVTKKLHEGDIKIAASVMWDLDNLKYINDTYGHDYGDQYIKAAAKTLSELKVYNSIVARMSGDEFYAFIYGYQSKQEIREIVEIMQEKLYNTTMCMPDGAVFRIRASVGMAWYPDDSESYDELIKYSDFAMYQIKNNVKGKIGEFNRESYNKNSFLLHDKEKLNRFIDEELVEFVFQPIVDAKNGSVFAYEALMRPQIDTLKFPIDIIKLAHSQSKLYDIERIVWFKAMEAFEEQRKAFGDAKIFINSIPNYILSDEDLQLFENRYKSDLHRIVVEITENEQVTKKKQHNVVRWNSQLALDDFGSGYNSEIALLVFSPSFVKIDMTIIRDIDSDSNRQELFKNLLSYAKNRHIKTIAEGIETKAEMHTLIEFGVDYVQGFYLGKPSMIPQQISPKIAREIYEKNN